MSAPPAAARSRAGSPADQGMGFLRTLFDFHFDSFISTKMIRVIYAIVMAVDAISRLSPLSG